MSPQFTVDELMVATVARCFGNDDQVCNGLSSFIPVCAIRLAQLTHAPDLVWVAGSHGVDPARPRLTDSTFEWPIWSGALMYVDVERQLWDYVSDPRYLQTFCVGAAQIDAFGNLNNSVIGDFHRPRVRLPGTAGLADMSCLAKRLICIVTEHDRRTLVERVDFRSGIGYLDGYGERARLGLGGGPALVVTDLAVLDFEPGTERMRLVSVHPGVSVDDVLERTGFVPVLPEDVPVTPAPSAEEVRLLREVIDPEGYRRRGVGDGDGRYQRNR